MCRRLKLLFLWVFATHLSIQYCLSFSAGCDVNYCWQEAGAMKKWTSPRCERGHCDPTALPCTSAWSGWCCASLCCQKLFRSQSAESRKEGPLLTLHCYLTVHLMAFRTWVSTKEPHKFVRKLGNGSSGLQDISQSVWKQSGLVYRYWWLCSHSLHLLHSWQNNESARLQMVSVANQLWYLWDHLYPAAYRRINSAWPGSCITVYSVIYFINPVYYMDTSW